MYIYAWMFIRGWKDNKSANLRYFPPPRSLILVYKYSNGRMLTVQDNERILRKQSLTQ